MFNVIYATLFLLITYHWHASLAVSTWPSGRLGIAAEVNGSPTDARLNIPVVKRSSNQAELANELPPRHSVVVLGDSREELDEFLAVGHSHPTHREYANRTLDKSTEPIIHREETEEMMIERALDHNYVTKWNADEKRTGEGRKISEKMKFRINSRIPGKEVVPTGKRRTSPTTIAQKTLPDSRLFHDERPLTSTFGGRRKSKVQTGRSNSTSADVTEMMGSDEVLTRTEKNNETRNIGPITNSTEISELAGTPSKDSKVLSRSTRQVVLSNIGRIDNVGIKPWKPNKNDEKSTPDYNAIALPNGSSLLSTSESSEHVNLFEGKNKPSVTGSSISSSLGIAKPLDSSRLHQQSRNTKPRAIVQHLRGDVNRQTRSHSNSPRLFRSNGDYRVKIRNAGPHRSGRSFATDSQNHRQLPNQQISNVIKSGNNPSQLRFIPFYNARGKDLKPFTFQGSNGNAVNEIVTFSENGELTQRNITDLSSFDDEQIENLSKSLGNVFDRHLSAEQRYEFPNVRAILPNQVFIIPPRLIYDTKLLPAPFSFNEYFKNTVDTASVNNDNKDNRKKTNDPRLSIQGVFDSKNIDGNLGKRPTIPSRENTKEPVTSSDNFVTPLPSHMGQLASGVNQPEVPLVSTFPDEKYRVRGLEKMENPSRIPEHKTLQRDGDEPRANHKSPSETGVKDHSSGMRSSYDNSGNTYASEDKSGMRNVDHSTVTEVIDDEYRDRHTTGYGDVPNMNSGTRMRTQIPGRQRDGNYDRDGNKWRGDNDKHRMHYLAKYSFGYLVNDNKSQNDFGHFEMRDVGITKGRYHVKLPDGRIQKVNYHVDDNGYHAVVTYRHDETQ